MQRLILGIVIGTIALAATATAGERHFSRNTPGGTVTRDVTANGNRATGTWQRNTVTTGPLGRSRTTDTTFTHEDNGSVTYDRAITGRNGGTASRAGTLTREGDGTIGYEGTLTGPNGGTVEHSGTVTRALPLAPVTAPGGTGEE